MQKLTTLLFASASLLFSCNTAEPSEEVATTTEQTTVEMEETAEYHPLQDVLDERRANFNEKATDEKKKVYAEGIQDILDKGILDKAMKVGDTAPNFTLTNATGEAVSLQSYLDKGPVVLTWYRGGWCPYCNLTLARLQEELPNFQAEGANLLALTPEVPDSSISTSEKHELTFEVLSDLDNTVAREYGVVFTLTPDVAEAYQNGFGLHEYNNSESNELPLAATYIINTNGEIVYAFVNEDYRNRAEPKDILTALKAIK